LASSDSRCIQTGGLIGLGERVVLEYPELARQYHPDLFAGVD